MKFTKSHEWVIAQNGNALVGITAHAQKELGEIVFADLPEAGQEVKAGDEIAVLESTKAAIDIYSPLSGKISKVNLQLTEDIGLMNSDPEGKGWLFEIEFANPTELDSLSDQPHY